MRPVGGGYGVPVSRGDRAGQVGSIRPWLLPWEGREAPPHGCLTLQQAQSWLFIGLSAKSFPCGAVAWLGSYGITLLKRKLA